VAKGNGGIREISPGKYVATMYDPRSKGGTKHVGTFTAERYGSRAAARDAAKQAKKEAEEIRDKQLEAEKAGGVSETCGSFAKRWPRDYTEKRGEPTLRWMEERTKAFIRDFGDRPLRGEGAITPAEARAWVVGGIVPEDLRAVAKTWDRAKTLPGGDVEVPSHKGNFTAIRSLFNDAAKTWPGQILNPFNGLRIERSRGRQDAIMLSEGELDILVQAAHETLGDYGVHIGALIKTAAWTGLRVGEIRALEISPDLPGNYVDIKAGEIHVRGQADSLTGKFRKPKTQEAVRTVFLLPPAVEALQLAMEDRTEGRVFLSQRDRVPLTPRSLGYTWGMVRAAFWQKLPPHRQKLIPSDFDFYELRHFFGTQLAEMHVSAEEIADQMGHADGGRLAQRLYIHPRRESVRASMITRFNEHQQRKKAIGE
jgi:integrase